MSETTSPGTWPPELVAMYARDYPALVRLAYLLCGSREVAEEAVQDGFVAVCARWSEISESPAGYLRRTVTNAVHQRHRHTQVANRYLNRMRRAEVAEPPGGNRAEISEALDRLTWPQRVSIVARYWLDLEDTEIAGLLGCRPATVRSHLSRGRAVLRAELEEL